MSLREKLQREDFKIVYCVVDTDTTIGQLAIDVPDKPVTVISDGTDIPCLLLHHALNNSSSKTIYLKKMRQKCNDERVTQNIEDNMETFDKVTLQHTLFGHAFAVCDTTSSIFDFGKTNGTCRPLRNCTCNSEIF